MDFYNWLLFASAIVIASISPGPNILIVVAHSLKYGWKNAVATIGGNLICLFCIALLAALGVGTMLKANPIIFTVFKTAGAIYLIYMGLKILIATRKLGSIFEDLPARSGGKAPHLKMIGEAILVSASNPKSVIFLSALFPQFIDADTAIVPQFAVMFGTIIVIVSMIHMSYAGAASHIRNRLTARRRKIMSQGSGLGFIGLGGGLLVAE